MFLLYYSAHYIFLFLTKTTECEATYCNQQSSEEDAACFPVKDAESTASEELKYPSLCHAFCAGTYFIVLVSTQHIFSFHE